MKIMWIINTIFPKPAAELGLKTPIFGGWLLGLFNELVKDKKIGKLIIATTYDCDKLLKYDDEKVTYYLVPCKNNTKYHKSQQKYWKEIVDYEKPDVVHVHGTEYPHSL